VTSADAVCNRCFTARDAVECLGQVDALAVNKVNVNVSNSGFFGTCVFAPVVDGTLITKRVTELLRLGRVNGVSIFLVFPKSTSWISVNRRYLLLWQPALRELFLYCHDSTISEEFIPWIGSWSNHYWNCSLCWPGYTNFTSQVHHERMGVDFVSQMLILSSWPAMFVCPACSLLCGFRAKRFKVRGCLLCQEAAAHLFNRENSAFYLHSIPTISRTISHSMYLNPRAVSILASHQSAIVDQTPRFNDAPGSIGRCSFYLKQVTECFCCGRPVNVWEIFLSEWIEGKSSRESWKR